MQLNGNTITDRYNRPSVTGRVGIRTFFLNDGAYVDPYDVSSCVIFNKLANASPSSVLASGTSLLKESATTEMLMAFSPSGDPDTGRPHDGETDATGARVTSLNLDWVAETLYTPGVQASGIYRKGVGEYVTVLDGTLALSGAYSGVEVANQCSAVQSYIDVWTVKMTSDSNYQVFINEFKLGNQNYVSTPQPLLLKTSNRLVNKHLTLDSIVDMKVTTEIVVENRDLSPEVKNLIQDFGISNAQVKIEKINEDSSLPPRESVLAYTDASQVTGDNTIIYRFNTTTLDLQGSLTGTYALTAKYSFLGQTIITEPYYFVVR
jgi:hypothetical protein